MTSRAWIRKLFGVSATRTIRKASARGRRPGRPRLVLEELEGRLAPAFLSVSSTADNNNPVITAGHAGTAADPFVAPSLRSAITFADSTPGGNTITFDSSLAGKTITLTMLDSNPAFGPTALVITGTIAIDGISGGITISGNNTERVFAVASGATLTLQDLTITGGNATGGNGGDVTGGFQGGGGGGGAGLGGAIYNYGTLDLIRSTLTGNTATGGNGGASITASRSIDSFGGAGGGSAGFKGGNFVGNSGDYAGGGGAGIGGLGDTNSGGTGGQGGANQSGTKAAAGADGTAGGGGGGASGKNAGGNATALSSGGFGGGGGGGFNNGGAGGFGGGGGGSSFTPGSGGFGGGGGGNDGGAGGAGGFGGGNGGGSSGGGGGGLGGAIFNNGGSVTITNSTLDGNIAKGGSGASSGQGLGGAVFSRNGTLTIINSTLSGDTAAQGGRDVYVLGDGAAATATLSNSILGQADTAVSDFVAATINSGTTSTSGSNDLIRTQTGFNGMIVSTADPLLAPLGSYGGPTQTLALLPGSPAIDAGDNSAVPAGVTTDQRGDARMSGAAVDIGAFESRGFTVSIAGGNNQEAIVNTAFAAPLSVQVSSAFSEPVQGGVVTFAAPSSGAGATFAADTMQTLDAGGNAALAATANGTVGTYDVTVSASGSNGTSFSLTNLTPIALSPAMLPDGIYGHNYNQTLTASGGAGGPYTFAVMSGSPPTGVSLASDGMFTGSPTVLESSSFTVTATDSAGFTGSQAYTLTIDPAPLTVTANSTSKTYGQTVTFAGTEFTTSGLVNGDTVTSVALASAGAAATATVAGSPYAITASAAMGSGLSNYSISYVNGALTVTPAPLTVTANPNHKTYGQTTSDTGTVTGVVNGDGITASFSSPGDVATAPIGSYAITATLADPNNKLGNYAVHESDAILTVTAAVPHIFAATDPNGDVELFAIGADHAVWLNSQTSPNGPFGGWFSLGGNVKQLTVGTNKNGTLQVFGIGAGNAAWFRQQQAGSLSWSDWQSLGGFVKQLNVGRQANGDLELFGIGAANAVWVNSQASPEGTFGGWFSLGGSVVGGTGLANSPPNHAPVVQHPISNFTVPEGSAPTFFDLAGHFSDPDIDATGPTEVTFNTSAGPMNVNLFDTTAPQNVANFLDYVNTGTYDNAVFNRLSSNFVLQGGGISLDPGGNSFSEIPKLNPVPIEGEFSLAHPNTAGTLDLALGDIPGTATTDPNSGTNQFFFNLVDNSKGSNGLDAQGFTAFGEVADAQSQAVLTSLASTPTKDESTSPVVAQFPDVLGGSLGATVFPLNNYNGTPATFPSDATASNFLTIHSITLDHQDEKLTYSVVGNTNSSLVSTSLTNEFLKLSYTAGKTGSATITVRATDRFGATVDESFTVLTVAPPGAGSVALSWTGANQLTATVTGSDPNNVPVSLNYVWTLNGSPVRTINGTSSLTDTLALGSPLTAADHVTVSVTPGSVPAAPPVTATAGAAVVSAVNIALDSTSSPTTLSANATGTDQQGETLSSPASFDYQWFQNGSAISGQQNQTLNLSALSSPAAGTQVTVHVTPLDHNGVAGAPFMSKPVILTGASPFTFQTPAVTAVTITPDSLTNTTTLTATPTSAGPDSYSFQWFQNGTPISGASGTRQTLNLSTATLPTPLAANDEFAVQVTPSEGALQGTAFTTGPVTINATSPTVSLTTPVITSVGINAAGSNPAVFTTTSTLTATVLFQDQNQHAVNFQWFQNGQPIAGQNASTLNLASLSGVNVGDNFAVEVAPVGGQSVISFVTIAS